MSFNVMGSLRLKNIPTKALRAEGRWSLHQDLDRDSEADFFESVKQFGIIRPVLVQEEKDGYEVVCGIKRLRAARDILAQAAIDCLVIPAGLEVPDLLRLIIEDQKLSGPLSPIE
ncbi:MAG: ParB/RepB/Spo0J family partition protein, partial [Desulfofustis sp.]|nr:ParB/RepB/Spo0J family partition protein [Desulfofustis sp.]